ncbi:MAG: VWA domain-containing protein [Thaumarchaeota archaeon]|nr:VWA domain-containing protein [Nitrososphaerota archaeon]
MKFYNQVLWHLHYIAKCKPEDIRLLISEKFELPYLGEDDNGKILYLPKPVKKKNGFTLNGLVFENSELCRILMMKTFMASLEHLGIHSIISDFSIYEEWLNGKEQKLATFVIDRIEDLCVTFYMKTRLNELLKNIAIANAVSFATITNTSIRSTQFFLQSALLSLIIAGQHKFVIPSKYKKDLLAIITSLHGFEKFLIEKEREPNSSWWFDEDVNEKKTQMATTIYDTLVKYGFSKDIARLPYTDTRQPAVEATVLKVGEVMNVLPNTFKMQGLQFSSDPMLTIMDSSFKNVANNLMHDLVMEYVRKYKVIENYKEVSKNTQFDDIVYPEQDLAEYARTYAQYKRPISKITEQIKFMVNEYDSDPNKDLGQIDMQAAIQSRATQSGNTNVFIRDDTPKRTESWAILLDTSHSLRPFSIGPRDMALCLAETAKELIDWDSWGLYAFDNKFVIVKELKEVYGQDVRARIGGLGQGGLSFIPDALEVTARILVRARAEYNYLFVISDGLSTGYQDIEEKLVKTIKQLQRRGITIISIGVGTEGLKRYSLGPSYKVDSVYDLLSKFTKIYSLLMAN